MSKEALVQALCDNTNSTKKACKGFLQALPRVIVKLAKQGPIRIFDLGTFTVKTRAARTGRNPQTGAPVDIPAKTFLSFSPTAGLKDM